MKNPPPSFNGYEQTTDFERARTQFSTPFDYLDVALDNAISNLTLPIAGDFLYIDTAFDGIATIELNNEHSAPKAPFKVQAGWAIQAIFKQVKFSCAAQTGKKIRFMFSTGERVVPANSASVVISNTITTIEDGFTYGSNYKSVTALGINAPDTIFTPGANLNGAVVEYASFLSIGAAGTYGSILAKSSAPVSNIDGDVIVPTQDFAGFGASYIQKGLMQKPVKIAAGKGLYFIASTAETSAMRSVLYNLL